MAESAVYKPMNSMLNEQRIQYKTFYLDWNFIENCFQINLCDENGRMNHFYYNHLSFYLFYCIEYMILWTITGILSNILFLVNKFHNKSNLELLGCI